MYPFWAVEHKTAEWLRMPVPGRQTLAFNMERKALEFVIVTVGAVNSSSIAITTTVSVPALTNSCKLQKGDRLIAEARPLPFKGERKTEETWKTGVAQAAKAARESPKDDSKLKAKKETMIMDI